MHIKHTHHHHLKRYELYSNANYFKFYNKKTTFILHQIEKVKAATIAAGNWPAATSSNTDVKNPPPPPFPAHVDDEDEEGLC